jgi:hypothetical protein
MLPWKRFLLVLLTSSQIYITKAAAEDVPCDSPKELSAVSISQAIQSVCILAKEAVPDGAADPLLVDEVNNSIRLIGGKVGLPNPFGRCWWDSRFDCLKAKEAVVILGDQVAAFEDAHYSDAEIAAKTRVKRSAVKELRDSLEGDIHFFCNTLRH